MPDDLRVTWTMYRFVSLVVVRFFGTEDMVSRLIWTSLIKQPSLACFVRGGRPFSNTSYHKEKIHIKDFVSYCYIDFIINLNPTFVGGPG